MQASELVQEIVKHIAEYGDMPVRAYKSDGDPEPFLYVHRADGDPELAIA